MIRPPCRVTIGTECETLFWCLYRSDESGWTVKRVPLQELDTRDIQLCYFVDEQQRAS